MSIHHFFLFLLKTEIVGTLVNTASLWWFEGVTHILCFKQK